MERLRNDDGVRVPLGDTRLREIVKPAINRDDVLALEILLRDLGETLLERSAHARARLDGGQRLHVETRVLGARR